MEEKFSYNLNNRLVGYVKKSHIILTMDWRGTKKIPYHPSNGPTGCEINLHIIPIIDW